MLLVHFSYTQKEKAHYKSRTVKDSTTRHKNTRIFLRTVGVFNILFLC